MRFKFWIASFLFALISQSAMAQGKPCNEPASAFLGALFKGVIDVPCDDSPSGKVEQPNGPNTSSVQTQEQKDAINAMALKSWNYGASNTTIDKSCVSASWEIMRGTHPKEFCREYLFEQLKAKNARIYVESRQREEAQNAQRRSDYQKLQKSMIEESNVIAARVEAGDSAASDLCTGRGEDFHNTCMPLANAAFIRALRSKKVQPKSCEHFLLANTKEGDASPSAMLVSIDSDGKFGAFKGEVTQLDGKTLAIYDRVTRSNAIAIIDSKTQVFNGGSVAVGMEIFGAGVQTSTRQVKLAAGQSSTVAIILAKCIQGY